MCQGWTIVENSDNLITDFSIQMNKRKKKQIAPAVKKLMYITAFVFTAVLIAAGAGVYSLHTYATTPAGSDTSGILVVVGRGQGFSKTTSVLVKKGLIVSPVRFKLIAAVTGADKKIKAGEYKFSSAMTPRQIIADLTRGKVHLYKVTIPEGYNIYQIAGVLEKAGIISGNEFLAVVKNPEVVNRLGISDSAGTLEGYLFPDTYYFSKDARPEMIARTMVDHLRSVYRPEWFNRGKEIGFTMHEVLTLASIIEKETGDASERPIISSVFHNRLKKRMRLETDPTVIYGIENFDGNLTKKHLRTRTPYNTYKIKGLPPGPIASPGEKSIEAALYPAESDYLFFVSRKDKTHQFSTNIRDHINSVRKYQLRKH